ncbi:MAG TPA: hypothetical protein PKI93_05620 [Alphaproteobacteria bacterium]|nr:hypothetical protein [Alphaproteobacteria bacterium]HNS44524.1 hypothetical protein [Alphaproteobacteria bacterium]
MKSSAVNNALLGMKLSFLNAAIISHSFKSIPDEMIAESLEECTANGTSCLLVPFSYPTLLHLFDNASSAQNHKFPKTPQIASILNNKGYTDLEKEMGKYGFYVSALLVGRDHAEMTITKTPPAIPIREHTEIKLG